MLLATLLRTPGHDFELALGYLFGLGLIDSRRDVTSISYCTEHQQYQQLSVTFRAEIPEAALQFRSPEWVHGGCGACGGARLAEVAQVEAMAEGLDREWLCSLPAALKSAQQLFSKTGGVHGAARVGPGEPLTRVFEDVGRHNAVDKLVGALLQEDQLPASGQWMLLSGRAGFELVQKAVRAGFSGVASLGPPTTLAVHHARQAHLRLVGFLSQERFNLYCE